MLHVGMVSGVVSVLQKGSMYRTADQESIYADSFSKLFRADRDEFLRVRLQHEYSLGKPV